MAAQVLLELAEHLPKRAAEFRGEAPSGRPGRRGARWRTAPSSIRLRRRLRARSWRAWGTTSANCSKSSGRNRISGCGPSGF